jgi:isoleucyl-tRNA synthetase
MPFAQVHYPFERAEWFESHFPADFIVEYVAQTRGWFYTMHLLATSLFDRPPFRHCVAHGVVLGDDGRKMSKRLGNYPEPDMVFDMWGADAMRWFLLSSPILRGQDLVVHAKGIEEVRRQVLNPIWSAWYFLSLYANVDGIAGRRRTDATGVLDRYILAKTASLVDDVTASMDGFDIFAACASITRFLDALNNWYIRRSRDRFWRARDGSPEVESDKADAYDTLSTVLVTLCKVAAPLLPLLTEGVYRGLTRERSVHLADWPGPDELPADPDLVEVMDIVRDVSSAAHAVRKANGRRARLPLRRLTVATARPERLRPFVALIEDEVNVKEVVLTDEVGGVADQVLTLVHAALGPRLGPDTQRVTAAVRAGDWQLTEEGVTAGGVALEPGEFVLVLRPRNDVEGRTLPDGVGVVTLDTTVDDDLESEGLARDMVRLVQQARREAGLHVSDCITVEIGAHDEMVAAVRRHIGYVKEQTLAVEIALTVAPELSILVAKTPCPGS